MTEAFEDTWHWNESAERAFDDVMNSGNCDDAEMLRAFRSFLKENDMMAYLTMMAVRQLELHRVLKPHRNPVPVLRSHSRSLSEADIGWHLRHSELHQRDLMEANECPQRFQAREHPLRQNPRHSFYFYSKSSEFKWKQLWKPHDESYIASHYVNTHALRLNSSHMLVCQWYFLRCLTNGYPCYPW